MSRILTDGAYLVASTLSYCSPVLFAGIGGQMSLVVGELNIALEGMMLAGAFTGVVAGYFTGSTLAGVMFAALSGAVIGALFGSLTIYLKANGFLVGIVFNIMLAALTVFLLKLFFGVSGAFSSASILPISGFHFANGADSPLKIVIGSQNYLSLLLFLIVPAWAYTLHFTALGLRLRAIGDKSEAAQSAGINVPAIKLAVQCLCGALAALAGAGLSLGTLTLFSSGMSAGRGFVAVAIVILVGARPWWLVAAALGFGASDAIGLRLESLSLPPQVGHALPYALTMMTLCLVVLRRRRLSSMA